MSNFHSQKFHSQKLFTPQTIALALLIGVVTLFVAGPTSAFAQEGPPLEEGSANLFTPNGEPIPAFIPGTVLVGLRGDVAASASLDVDWGAIEVLAVEPLDVRTGEASVAGQADALIGYKLTVPVGTELGAVEALTARADVVFAEPDWLAQIAQVEPDSAVAESPYVVDDTLYPDQWYVQRIGMSRAWSLAVAESAGSLSNIEVVVIDTGADLTHPDLAGRLGAGHNYLNGSSSPQDDNGHGTHISGLIAAAANGRGIVGTGLNVEIIPFKALDYRGTGGVSGIGQAIRDAADMGADIINMSLELSVDTFVLRSAVQYAVSEGTMIIAASGNFNRLVVSYPAAYPSVMAVGSSTYFDARAPYSNRGPELDILAPGGYADYSVLSTWTSTPGPGAKCPDGLREVNSGLYCEADGTSMATGVASGLAALIMSLRPDLNADEVQAILLDSAHPIAGTSEEVGRGRLDAARAVRLALEPHLVYVENTVKVTALQGGPTFTVTLPLTNPSLKPLTVVTTPTITTTWYAMVGPRAGEVSYGAPLEVQLVFTPTAVTTGNFTSSIRVTTTTESGSTSVFFVNTSLTVYSNMVGNAQMFVPWLGAGEEAYSWAEPSYRARTNYTVGNSGNIVVDLPFSMTVGGGGYNNLRIFADGFVVAAATAFPGTQPNTCLDNQDWPPFSAYGWWSDLSLNVNSQLSTFQPDADRFVVEYSKFISEGSSDPDDLVSVQIVLSRDGEVQLNYQQVPEHAPESITVGASAGDGRFYNQVTCYVEGTTRIGEVPKAHQTFIFNTGDLY